MAWAWGGLVCGLVLAAVLFAPARWVAAAIEHSSDGRVRITDARVLDAKAKPVAESVKTSGGTSGSGTVYLVSQRGDDAMVSLRYALGDATVEAATESFRAGKREYPRGSWIVRGGDADALKRAAEDVGVAIEAVAAAPKVATRPVAKPRLALLHTWQWTQSEGWWRLEFDRRGVPFAYISTQDVARDGNLNAKYDVIVFAPGVGNPQQVVSGMPMFGNPLPYHYVGRAESLPTLTIIANNSMWGAVRQSTLDVYPEGKAAKANIMPLTELRPSPDFEKVVESCGGYGEKVETADAVMPALERAMDKVRSGTPATLNVMTRPRH